MSIASRAITSAEERLKNTLEHLAMSKCNEDTRAKKKRMVDVARYTLAAVREKAEREATP